MRNKHNLKYWARFKNLHYISTKAMHKSLELKSLLGDLELHNIHYPKVMVLQIIADGLWNIHLNCKLRIVDKGYEIDWDKFIDATDGNDYIKKIHYYVATKEDWQELKDNGTFLELEDIYDNYYQCMGLLSIKRRDSIRLLKLIGEQDIQYKLMWTSTLDQYPQKHYLIGTSIWCYADQGFWFIYDNDDMIYGADSDFQTVEDFAIDYCVANGIKFHRMED